MTKETSFFSLFHLHSGGVSGHIHRDSRRSRKGIFSADRVFFAELLYMYIFKFCAHRWPTYCIMARFIPCAYILSTCSTFIARKSRAEGVDSRVSLFSSSYYRLCCCTRDSWSIRAAALLPRESGLLNYSLLEGSDAAFPCKKIANAPL